MYELEARLDPFSKSAQLDSITVAICDSRVFPEAAGIRETEQSSTSIDGTLSAITVAQGFHWLRIREEGGTVEVRLA